MKINLYKSYLQMIENSVGTELFRNFYVVQDTGEEYDVLNDGEVSCAVYVSGILFLNKLLPEMRALISRLVEDLEKKGWAKIEEVNIQTGDIVVWEKGVYSTGEDHAHIGFYIGDGFAVSTSSKEKCVVRHDWRKDGRGVEMVLRHPKLATWTAVNKDEIG